MRPSLTALAVVVCLVGTADLSSAVTIEFTGGTAYRSGGGTYVPNNTDSVWDANYYEEDGYRVDFIDGGNGEYVGVYYGPAMTDVAHGHMAPSHGDLTEIRVSKIDGTPFALESFVLTSNTIVGGGSPDGTEQTYINASMTGAGISYSQLLPPEAWGDNAPSLNPLITLGSEFSNVMWASITVASEVYCIGIDNLTVNDAQVIPEPATLSLLALGGLGLLRRRRKH